MWNFLYLQTKDLVVIMKQTILIVIIVLSVLLAGTLTATIVLSILLHDDNTSRMVVYDICARNNIPYIFGEEPEALCAYNALHETDRVLEIGGNIGRVSIVLATKLLDGGRKLVSLEPNMVPRVHLQERAEGFNLQVIDGVLNDQKDTKPISIEQTNTYGIMSDSISSTHSTPNYTFKEIKAKSQVDFNALVIDCEGCYEDIFIDADKNGWLKEIDKIVIEWDGEFMESFLLNNGFQLTDIRSHPNLIKGVRAYKRQ